MRLGYRKAPIKSLLYLPNCRTLFKIILDCMLVIPNQLLCLPSFECILLVYAHIYWSERGKLLRG